MNCQFQYMLTLQHTELYNHFSPHIQILMKFFFHFHRHFPIACLLLLTVFPYTHLYSQEYLSTHPMQRTDSLIATIEKDYLSKGNQCKILLEKLHHIAIQEKSSDLLVQSIYLGSLTEYSQYSNQSKWAQAIDSLLHVPEIMENDNQRMLLLYASSLDKLSKGEYMDAFRVGMQAYDIAVETNNRNMIYKTAVTLGNIGPYFQNYRLSENFYRIAKDYVDGDKLNQDKLTVNSSRLQYTLGNYDSAIYLIHKVIDHEAMEYDSGFMTLCLINLGSYYKAAGIDDSSMNCYQRALQWIENVDNSNIRGVLFANIGNHHRDIGQYDTAMMYYEKAKELCLRENNLSQYANIAYNISIMYNSIGQPDSAFAYLKEYNNLTAKILQPQTSESYRNYVDMVMELSQNRVQLSQQAIDIKNKQLIIAITSGAALVLSTLLVLYAMAERRKSMRQLLLLKEVENKELSDQLEMEQRIKQLQDQQIEQKRKEITSYTLLLSGKNQILFQIKELLRQMEKTQDPNILKKIQRSIDENLHTDDDYWEQFVLLFNQVDAGFFERLKDRFKDLTQNEIRLCAYIRIGMTSKQIAQMLNLSPESVNKNRYRLRKKLALDREEDLDNCIMKV